MTTVEPWGIDAPLTGRSVAMDPTPHEKFKPLPDREYVYIEWPQLTDLQMRAFLWLIGIPSPSLIHNGKKRRKA